MRLPSKRISYMIVAVLTCDFPRSCCERNREAGVKRKNEKLCWNVIFERALFFLSRPMEKSLFYIISLSSPFPLSIPSKLHFLSRNPYKISSSLPSSSSSTPITSIATTRRVFSALAATSPLLFSYSPIPSSNASALSNFFELEGSGGVKVLDLRKGDGEVPVNGDQVAIHYYGRLAAKQGWRFDSTYDHKDEMGDTVPFVFIVGSGKVISGINSAVKSMKAGGLRRVIIPPSQGYQNTSQEPIPPNFFDRQRLFTTIFNPTRLANGEGSTLGTLIFDIELVSVRHPNTPP